jgi:hypothetical protein
VAQSDGTPSGFANTGLVDELYARQIVNSIRQNLIDELGVELSAKSLKSINTDARERSATKSRNEGNGGDKFWRILSGIDTSLKIATEVIDAYEDAKRLSTPAGNTNTAGGIVSKPTRTAQPTNQPSAALPKNRSMAADKTCVSVPNPAAIACLHAPLLINGQPNLCNRQADGSYIPLMIQKCQ